MNTARVLLFVLAIGLAASISLGVANQDPQRPNSDRSKFMQAKVEHSKAIVEGLAMENFDTIAQKAQDLMLLMNESTWNVIQTPEYVDMGRDFKSAAEHLREAAHSKNIDGATLAFFEVTLNCVRCHKYVRRWAKK